MVCQLSYPFCFVQATVRRGGEYVSGARGEISMVRALCRIFLAAAFLFLLLCCLAAVIGPLLQCLLASLRVQNGDLCAPLLDSIATEFDNTFSVRIRDHLK